MNYSVFKFACVIGMMFLAGSETSFISYPKNEMALANERVEFQCGSDSTKSLKWSVAYALTTEVIGLFTRGNFTDDGKSKYRIDTRIPEQCNLIIDAVDLSYAGKYMCTEEPFGPEVEAQLAVIGPQPSCRTNASSADNAVVENDDLWMMCSLNFSGNLSLNMSWFKYSTGSAIHNTSNSRNQSTVAIPVNSSDNGETFTFRATFRQENNSNETVVTWNFTVKVLYTPRSLVIKPDGGVYQIDDRLECSADGNPTPSYEWTDTGTNRTISGSVLTIEKDLKPGQNHAFRCTAYNTVAGLRKEVHSDEVTFRVAGITTQTSHSAVTLIGSVVTAMLLCIVIVIVVFVCSRVNANGWTIKQTVLMADPEPDIIRSDPANRDNDYYVTDDGVAQETGPAFSIYELIEGDDNETVETPTDSLRSSQQVLVPAYTRVNKNVRRQERRSREMQVTQQQTPVYSEIAQTDLTPLRVQGCNMSDLQSSTRIANQKNYFGADGTEYTQMNNLSLQDRPAEMIPKDPMFRPVDNYAQIDHTKRAPPPPPKL